MAIIDWVVIGVALIMALIGYCVGFGKCLKFFTSGIFGIIISVVVVVLIFKPVTSVAFVSDLGTKFNDMLLSKNSDFCRLLAEKIPTFQIIVGVALFVVAQIVRIIIVTIIKSIAEINNGFMRFVNRLFGAIFLVAVAVVLCIIFFAVVHYIGGNSESWLTGLLADSKLKINELYAFFTEYMDKLFPPKAV